MGLGNVGYWFLAFLVQVIHRNPPYSISYAAKSAYVLLHVLSVRPSISSMG